MNYLRQLFVCRQTCR